jgi:hypothetical protein
MREGLISLCRSDINTLTLGYRDFSHMTDTSPRKPVIFRLSERDITWLDAAAQALGLSRNRFVEHLISGQRAANRPRREAAPYQANEFE